MGQKKVGEEGRSDYGVPLVREEGVVGDKEKQRRRGVGWREDLPQENCLSDAKDL